MDLFQWLTDTTEGKCLFTTLVSMIPIIELRGGIPFGVEVVLGYLAAKEAEWTAVRIIMSGRMAGMTADAIRERLRDQYV